MLKSAESLINEVDMNSLGADEREWFASKRVEITDEMNKAKEMPIFNPGDIELLGPKPFRKLVAAKNYDLELLPPREVVPFIEKLFSDANNEFSLESYVDESLDSRIAVCYSLMNWAGYYSDDFDKTKKGKDRFNASSSDLAHTVIAAQSNFFLTNDNDLRMKAVACYTYLGLPVKVMTPKEFMINHFRIDGENISITFDSHDAEN